MTSTGERFVQALAAKDAAGITALLADEISFKGLTPQRFWEAATPAEVVDVLLGHWFDDGDRIDSLVACERGEAVGDLYRVGYRFDLTCSDGPYVVEQQAYVGERDGRIHHLRVVCSGFRPRR